MDWKLIGIVSLIFNIIFVLLFILAFSYGNGVLENENECIVNVCSMDHAASYSYDDYSKTCSCYDMYGSVIYDEVLG